MDIARMRFQSAKDPSESGTLALSSDGTVRVEPSEPFLEAMANLELAAVERSARVGATTALGLIALGIVAAAMGWLAGRAGGKLRERLTNPVEVGHARLEYAADRGFRLQFIGRPATSVSMTWSPGEYNADEAEEFAAAFERIRSQVAQ